MEKDNIALLFDAEFLEKLAFSIDKDKKFNYFYIWSLSELDELLLKTNIDYLITNIDIYEVKNFDYLRDKNIIPTMLLSKTIDATMLKNILKLNSVEVVREPFVLEEINFKVEQYFKNKNKDEQLLELKNNFDENLDYKSKLAQEQVRLSQSDYILRMVAHQWRQPLGAVSSAIFSIETKLYFKKFNFDKKEDRDKFLEFLYKKNKKIGKYIQYLSNTIDNFRNYFKPDLEKKFITLDIIVRKVLEVTKSSLSSNNITVVYNCDNEEMFLLYPNEMIQVVLNLIKNSEENFSSNNIANPKIDISIYKDGQNCIVKIMDNGGGISDEILPNIFKPYFSTKSNKNGTGLGLYMSKIIVEEHNFGILSVKNNKNGVESKIVFDTASDDKK